MVNYQVLIDSSPIVYYLMGSYADILLLYPYKYQAKINLQNYHFITTKRNPCDNNLHDCWQACFARVLKCRYPFYEARNLPKCNDTQIAQQFYNLLKFMMYEINQCNCLNSCVETEKQSFVKKTLKITISLILLCISAYQIYYLIDSYFEYPLYKTVSLVRDDIIQFPLIITCDEESHEILNAKKNLAKQLNTDCDRYQLWDLLHQSSQFANKPLQLWNASSTFNDHNNFLKMFLEKYGKNVVDQKFANVSVISTIFGICNVFTKNDMLFFQKSNELNIFNEKTSTCNSNQTHFIISENQNFHPKYLFYMPTYFSPVVEIMRQTLIRINTPKSPCKPNNKVSECEQKCYTNKLEQQTFNCRLPFMEFSALPLCFTSETAKSTQRIYLETQLKTNPQKDCSCAARCNETIFHLSVVQTMKHEQTCFLYRIDDNIRE
uniref:Uncharacterized protein n=1 Tax=Strigamia maritima TaxID=126957 RepID=T1IVZ0_STRMM